MTERVTSKLIDSTSTALGSAETYTGNWVDVRSFNSVSFAVRADQNCTLYADFTTDLNSGTTDSTLTYKIAANINEVHRLSITRSFFRIRIVNGSAAQSYLSASVMAGDHNQLAAPINLSLGLDSDAIAVRPTIPEDEIVIGKRSGVRHFTQFGYGTNLTAAGGEEVIWATSAAFTPMTTASTFTITYNNTTDGEGQNGALTIYIDYIDSNGLAQQTTHTLGSSGSDVTSFSGLGINRGAISSSGSTDTNGSAITITETTGGTTQGYIPAGEGVTQQAIYHVDSNSYAVGKLLYIKCNKLSGGSSPRVLIKAYVYNRAVQTKYQIFRDTINTATDTTVNLTEPVGFRLSPTDIVYFVADTDTNSTEVDIRFSVVEYKLD